MGTPCSFFTGTCQIHHLVHQDFTNTNFGTFIEQSFDNIKLPFCERSIIRFIWNWFFERFLYKLFCPIFLSNTFIGDLKGSFGNFNASCIMEFFHEKQLFIIIVWFWIFMKFSFPKMPFESLPSSTRALILFTVWAAFTQQAAIIPTKILY